MLDQNILDSEFLYRRITSNPNMWKDNRPSSAAFKDSRGGVSVDRDGGQSEIQIKERYKSFDLKAVVKIKVEKCRAVPTHPIYTPYPPEDDNIYHSEIHDSDTQIVLTGSKPKKLSLESIIAWEY